MNQADILARVASGEMTIEDAQKLLAESNERRGGLSCKVSSKGGVSIYGLGRWPVTLYIEQWERLLEFGDTIRQFIKDHEPELKRKE